MSTEIPLSPGCFPSSGAYWTKLWAEVVFQCSEETLNKWIDDKQIPVAEMPGRKRFVDAQELWTRIRFGDHPPSDLKG